MYVYGMMGTIELTAEEQTRFEEMKGFILNASDPITQYRIAEHTLKFLKQNNILGPMKLWVDFWFETHKEQYDLYRLIFKNQD